MMDVKQVDPASPVSPLHELLGPLHADNVSCFRIFFCFCARVLCTVCSLYFGAFCLVV